MESSEWRLQCGELWHSFASFYGLWSFVILLNKPEIVDLKKSSFTSKNCRGDIISFNCSADANPSMTSYQLFENETAILDTNPSGIWNRKLPTGGVFMYKCMANNYLGSEDSLPVIVKVNGTLNCAVYWICEAYFSYLFLRTFISLQQSVSYAVYHTKVVLLYTKDT